MPLSIVGDGDDRRLDQGRPLLSVVVPTYNRKEKLCRLLGSVVDSECPDASVEILVIDDGSSDGTDQMVRERFPNIKYVRTEGGSFISHARNVGIERSKGDLIFLIDDDNVVDQACLRIMVETFKDHPEAGMVGPLMLYLERPELIWCAGVDRSMVTSVTRFIGRGQVDRGQYSDLIPTKDLPNAFMVRRSAIAKAGMLDEVRFPIHYEESDWGERIRRAGFEIYCQPRAKDWHDIPAPSKGTDPLRGLHVHNPERAYYAGRNRVLFFRLYSGRLRFALYGSFFNWVIAAHYLITILRSGERTWDERKGIARSFIGGVFEGYRMRLTA